MAVIDDLNQAFQSIETRIDELDAQYDSVNSADPYFDMPDGVKMEYRTLMHQRELVRKAITSNPLPRDIDALNDPSYND